MGFPQPTGTVLASPWVHHSKGNQLDHSQALGLDPNMQETILADEFEINSSYMELQFWFLCTTQNIVHWEELLELMEIIKREKDCIHPTRETSILTHSC